ncbi:FRG domain-containing protein [Metabacillus fastidiosus]|uniref:FRG domain-containing protein n=1 Tax=Metabacillus fastidiosus TaxID=1458 RepID=A0ABU6P3R7_9BACI|nr:FRG domain-containing protein [Metabacillus fastidiosus]
MEKLEDGSLKAENWLDLQQELFSFQPHEIHGRYRSTFAYRGVDSSKFELETSLMRIKNTEMEPHLLRNFNKYARSTIKDNQNNWELLAVAQHYGLPTRLLDWSFSPYVALHFATSDISRFKEDGAVWCLDIVKVHEKLPSAFKDALEKEKSYVFTVDMLNDVTDDLNKFDSSKGDEDDFIICLEPPSIDERIVNQYAMFSLMTNSNRKLNDWLVSYPEYYKKIIIPSSLKLEIRDKLDQANINERMIYPGLQGISAWLKRYCTNIELMRS